jgi:hypothetical protein
MAIDRIEKRSTTVWTRPAAVMADRRPPGLISLILLWAP